jgi:hypothetical protein
VVPLTAAQQQRLVGVYDFGGNEQQLRFLTPSAALLGDEYMLLATSERSLFAPQNYVEYAVVMDSTGTVTSLQMSGSGAFSMRRVR